MGQWYRLEGHTPVPVDWRAAGRVLRGVENRRVAFDKIGDVEISTVFLALDHGWNGTPLLFETLVFGGPLDEEMDRYSTWEEAEEGHKAMMERVRAAIAKEG